MSCSWVGPRADRHQIRRERPLKHVGWLLGSALFAAACGSDGKTTEATPIKLTGRVFASTSGKALSGAAVDVGGAQVSTDKEGHFKVAYAVSTKQVQVEVHSKGHAYNARPAPKDDAYVEVVSKPIDVEKEIDPKQGGALSAKDGAKLSVQSDSLVHTKDKATLQVAVVDPRKGNDFDGLPGDFSARSGAKLGKLSAASPVYVQVDEDGKSLQLKPGKKATIALPQRASQKANESSLYHYSEPDGLWIEVATLSESTDENGLSVYTAEVDELGWYSMGTFLGELTCLSGCVLDESGAPAANTLVTSQSAQLFTRGLTYAGENGCYSVEVPASTESVLRAQVNGAFAESAPVSSAADAGPRDMAGCVQVPTLVLAPVNTPQCPLGYSPCGESCFDLLRDFEHCGTCEQTCGELSCRAAICVEPMGTTPDDMVDPGMMVDAGTMMPSTMMPDGMMPDAMAPDAMKPTSSCVPYETRFRFDEGVGSTAASEGMVVLSSSLQNFSGAQWVPGQLGEAIDFDGADDSILVGDTSIATRAISFWINPDSFDGAPTRDTGWALPNSFENGSGWTSPENAYAVGGGVASAGAAAGSSATIDYGLGSNSVPFNATVRGISVRANLDTGSSVALTMNVALRWAGTSFTTAKPASLVGGMQTVVVGAANDTWGRTWTSSDFDTSAFRVRVSTAASSGFYSLDSLEVLVTYTVPVQRTILSLDNNAKLAFGGLNDVTAVNWPGATVYIDGAPSWSLTPNQWTHVVVTSPNAITATNLEFGANTSDPSSLFFDGTMDDVKVFTTALTQADAQFLYEWAECP